MLNRTDKGDKDEEIVEPMEVVVSYMSYVLPWFSQMNQLVQVNKATTGSEEEGDEPAPPEPFEWKEEED